MIITNVIHLQLRVGKAMNNSVTSLPFLLVVVTTASIYDVGVKECFLCTVYWSCVLFLMNS